MVVNIKNGNLKCIVSHVNETFNFREKMEINYFVSFSIQLRQQQQQTERHRRLTASTSAT